MEPITPTQARQVWQRVRGTVQEENPLAQLLALEAECRQIYLYLQRNTPLRDSRGLAVLREESTRFFHSLMGLALIQDPDMTVTAPPAIRGNAPGLLRQSLVTRRRMLPLLEELSPDGAFCAKLLKQRMEAHCLSILELLGQLPRK